MSIQSNQKRNAINEHNRQHAARWKNRMKCVDKTAWIIPEIVHQGFYPHKCCSNNEQTKILPTLTDLTITHLPQSCSEITTNFKKVIRHCILLLHWSCPVTSDLNKFKEFSTFRFQICHIAIVSVKLHTQAVYLFTWYQSTQFGGFRK